MKLIGNFVESIAVAIRNLVNKWFYGNKKKPLVVLSQRQLTAAHEAGHAICCLHSNGFAKLRFLSIKKEEGRLGFIKWRATRQDHVLFLWENVIIRLGGLAAEIVVHGKFSCKGSESDLKMALAVTKKLCSIYTPTITPNDIVPLDLSKCFVVKISESEKTILNNCYVVARRRIRHNRLQFESLTRLLLDLEEMTEEQLDEFEKKEFSN